MKKTIFLLTLMILVIGCSSGGSENDAKEQSILKSPQPSVENEDVRPPKPPSI